MDLRRVVRPAVPVAGNLERAGHTRTGTAAGAGEPAVSMNRNRLGHGRHLGHLRRGSSLPVNRVSDSLGKMVDNHHLPLRELSPESDLWRLQ